MRASVNVRRELKTASEKTETTGEEEGAQKIWEEKGAAAAEKRNSFFLCRQLAARSHQSSHLCCKEGRNETAG